MRSDDYPDYVLLTTAQIEQIKICIRYGIELPALRNQVCAIWPQATAIELRTCVEYDDGSSYYWRIIEATVFDQAGPVVPAPEHAENHEEKLDDLCRSIRLGSADPEDDGNAITLNFDTPTLNELYRRA